MISITVADYLNPEHQQAILQLLDGYARGEAGGKKPLSQYVQENLLIRLAHFPGAFSILGYVNEKPAGLINCFETLSTFRCKPLINIHDIVTVSSYRRQGIASKMLSEVERVARERDCCKITLEVLEGNIPAREAYSKYGFNAYQLDPKFGQALFWEKVL